MRLVCVFYYLCVIDSCFGFKLVFFRDSEKEGYCSDGWGGYGWFVGLVLILILLCGFGVICWFCVFVLFVIGLSLFFVIFCWGLVFE